MLSKQQIRHLRRYCRDPIERIKGYKEALESTDKFDCHHINELTFTRDQLIKMNMYYDRPASELILMPRSDHLKLHQRHGMPSSIYGRPLSESHKKKIGYSNSGDKNGMYRMGSLVAGPNSPHWTGDRASAHAKYLREYRAKRRALRNLQNEPLASTD